MAGEIDIVVTKQAQAEVDKLLVSLKSTYEEIVKVNQNAIKFNGQTAPKNPSQLNNVAKEQEKITNSLINAEKRLQQERIKDLKLQQQREQAVDRYNAKLEKEQRLLSASQNLYNKTQTQLNAVQVAYNNLATKKERYNNLTAQEEQRLITLKNVTEKYNTTLKAVDATVGKHTRNVGNYASAFNPLSNSINQLGREAPAFANSMQTGFMAISNNLPIFFDAMGNVIAQNKELQAQGLPTKSVLSQLASSLFSFQTLLSVGVTLLTVYGKEIVSWVGTLWGASDALGELNKNQKEFNKARFEGKKDAQSDIIEVKKYLSVYNDQKLSILDREIAYKKLNSQYAYYIKNTEDATIKNGKFSEGVVKLLEDLKKQKALDKETDLQVANKKKLIDLQKELDLALKLEKAKKESLDFAVKSNVSAQALATASNELNRAQSKRILIEKDVNAYQEKINQNQKDIIKLTKERIGLEYQEDKQKDEKIRKLKTLADLEIKQADFYASDYALRKKILENSRDNNKAVFDDETKTFAQRNDAYDKMMQAKSILVSEAYAEEKRIIAKEEADNKNDIISTYNDRIREIKELESDKNVIYTDGANDRNQALAEKEKALDALVKDSFNKRALATKTFTQNQIGLATEYSQALAEVLKTKLSFAENENIISQETLNALEKYQIYIKSFTDSNSLGDFKKASETKKNIVEDETLKILQLKIDANAKEMEGMDSTTEAYTKLNKVKIALETEYVKIKTKNDEEELKRLETLKQNQLNYLDQFKQSWDSVGLKSLDFFTVLEQNGKTAFQNLIDGAINTKEEIGIALVGISEVFQDIMNKVNEASEVRYQNEIKRLESQKNIAIAYAGESETAKAEVERQYEAKRKKLEHDRAVQQKKMALTNAIINTAQAVIRGFVDSGYVGAILAGAIGAAQIAIISNQQIPEYFKGTDNHSGGLMLINDGKGSDYKEVVETPDGKLTQYEGRNVLTSAPKGTKVHTAKQWNEKLNSILMENSIMPMSNTSTAVYNGLSKAEFNEGIGRLQNTIENKESFSIERDVRGEKLYKIKQGAKTELLNNRLKIKSFNV